MIADDGMTIYIVPRKFDMLIENVDFMTSFESLCGFVKFKNAQKFANCNWDVVKQQMETSVSLSVIDFERMKSELVAKFQ